MRQIASEPLGFYVVISIWPTRKDSVNFFDTSGKVERDLSIHLLAMPTIRPNPLISAVATPPIADVHGWIQDREFPAERPLLDVCQAVPSYPPAEELCTHVGEQLHQPETSAYTDITGLPTLRSALAEHLSDDYESEIETGQVAITAGCNQAFCLAMDVIAGPGDEVVLPLPYYFNHQMWLAMRGIIATHPEFTEGVPAVEDIAARLTERTRAIAIVSPNNPMGVEYPATVIAELYELAREHAIALVIDETYKDFRSTEGPPHTLFQKPGWDDTFVHLFSFSKAYALTGYRVGALVAGRDFIEQLEKVLDCVAVCPSHVGQLAALYGLTNLADWRRSKADLMRSRVIALREAFRSNRLRYQLVSSGAYFAYVRHPFEGENATAVARRLADECNLLCVPGNMFGPGQENYLRFAFANLDASEIPSLVDRLVESQ